MLFLCYHGVGHINPCFPLVRTLEREGHTVTLATVEHFRTYVTRAGFKHYSLKSVPFGLGFESWVNSQRRLRFPYFANLRDRFIDRLYAERERELLSMLDALRPDVIFFDATQATDYIVLHPALSERRIRPAMLHAMFPTHVLPGRPPVDSTLSPGNPKQEKKELRRMNVKLNRTDLKQRMLYFGLSDRYIINRRLRRNKIPDSLRLDLPSLFDFQVAGIPSFILAPRQFDYPHFNNPSDFHYIGFVHGEHQSLPNDEWSKVSAHIRARRNAGSRLVYCSFGTIAIEREQQIDDFLLRLADAVTAQEHQLVVSVGKQRTAPAGLVRNNVWVFPSVPQTEVLELSDVFVTHGGLGSIKEAVGAVVPMLMIVVHDQFDPPGNAARVQYHGLGILGSIHDDVEQLTVKLSELMMNEEFASNIRHLRDQDINEAEGRFLQLFNSMLRDDR